MDIRKQLDTIDPSAKDALFRRLMVEESLGYLRDENTIIGFELDLDKTPNLSGYAVIGIKKHTILAYKSDLDEERKLILFPTLDKLFDESFELLNLSVIKCEYSDNTFIGKRVEAGILREVVRDLTPPRRSVDVTPELAEAISKVMIETAENVAKSKTVIKPQSMKLLEDIESAVDSLPQTDYEPMDEPFEEPYFEDAPFEFDDYELEPELTKAERLEAETFESLTDVGDFLRMELGVDNAIVTKFLNTALQISKTESQRVPIAVALFKKLFNENKI